MNQQQQKLYAILETAKSDFNSIGNASVSFEKEVNFAIQMVSANDSLMKLALDNPEQIKTAVCNIALTGLSLNPTLKLAYLLPRKNRIILEPSYMGLVKLLADSGSVASVSAEVVREDDDYEILKGTSPQIRHKVRFGDGNIIGVYAIGFLQNGLKQFETMSKKEIDAIMMNSEGHKFAARSNRQSTWDTNYTEMARKTVIRRLVKYLPKTGMSEQALRTLEIFDQNNPAEYEEKADPAAAIFKEPVKQQEPEKELDLVDWEESIKTVNDAAELTKILAEAEHLTGKAQKQVKDIIRKRKDELGFIYNPRTGFMPKIAS